MQYDVITIGGGLAGATLGKALSENGLRVLILERETAFKDRVRGEQIHCWGVAETRALGIYDLLKSTCGLEVREWRTQVAGTPEAPPRDLVETSPHRAGSLNFYHPEMQSVLLTAAEDAGATVRRGATVVGVSPGEAPTVQARDADGVHTFQARLVVGADGRNSGCRKWVGFDVKRDPERMAVAGVLFEGLGAPEHEMSMFIHPSRGQFSLTIPLGRRRFRTYVGTFRHNGSTVLSGHRSIPEFVERSIAAGAPSGWYEGAKAAGPLASFEGADSWVEHPYRDGVALVGDAAGSNDPSFGCGLSLTLRDVRVLRDKLLAIQDWDEAGHAYATEHDNYYGAIHRLTGWVRRMMYDPGPEAAALRARAFPLIAQDRTRRPDIVGLGPEFPSNEAARRRFFGEE